MTEFFDDDFEYQEFKQDMDAKSKHFQRWQSEQAQKYSDKVFNDLWNETLKEEGLDPQTYGNLASQDPEHVKAELKKSMKTLVSNVKKGRDSQGKFVSQTQPGKPTDSTAKLDALKEKARKRPLSHEEELDVLDAIFGPDPL